MDVLVFDLDVPSISRLCGMLILISALQLIQNSKLLRCHFHVLVR